MRFLSLTVTPTAMPSAPARQSGPAASVAAGPATRETTTLWEVGRHLLQPSWMWR
jgi:hypothetical protein